MQTETMSKHTEMKHIHFYSPIIAQETHMNAITKLNPPEYEDKEH